MVPPPVQSGLGRAVHRLPAVYPLVGSTVQGPVASLFQPPLTLEEAPLAMLDAPPLTLDLQ